MLSVGHVRPQLSQWSIIAVFLPHDFPFIFKALAIPPQPVPYNALYVYGV